MPVARRRIGAINLAPGGQSVSPVSGAEKGAAAGSSFGPWGTVIGAAVGAVVGLLSSKPNTAAHIGSWDTQLVNTFAALPPAAGVGREFQWNYDSQGLVQMLEALLATGVYMNWDTSILSNYSVCANWAVTLSNAVQVVATGVCKNAKGAKVSVSVTAQPGGPVGPGTFTFTNPGIMVGPEAVSDSVIMGASGVMTWLFNRWTIAGTPALSKQYASQMGNNAAAAKVYALMIDYVAAQLGVADQAITTDVASTVAAASTAASTATPKATTPTIPVAKIPIPVAPIQLAPAPFIAPAPTCSTKVVSGNATTVTLPATSTAPATTVTTVNPTCATDTPIAVSNAGTPVTSADISDALTSAGLDPTDPDVQSAVNQTIATRNGVAGLSNTELLIGGALALGAVWFLARKK
jgi:hypothetical protein